MFYVEYTDRFLQIYIGVGLAMVPLLKVKFVKFISFENKVYHDRY